MWELCITFVGRAGGEYKTFDSKGEAFKWCRDNRGRVNRAYFIGGATRKTLSGRSGYVVHDGKLVCQDCGVYLTSDEQGIYPVCAKCDYWEGYEG